MKHDYAHSIDCHSPRFIKLMSRLTRLLELSIRFNVRDIENIPASGGGILLMNHGAVPIDGMLLLVKFLKERGRVIRPLISPNMGNHVFLREAMLLWGGVDANAKNALALLRRGELLLIYPGGPREGLKDDRDKYKIMWEGQSGFIKLALLTGAPIIPIASIGLDENFHLISNGTFINRILFGPDAFLLPIVGPKRIIPKKVTLYVGKPITLPHPPETTKYKKLMPKLQQQVKETLEELISQHIEK